MSQKLWGRGRDQREEEAHPELKTPPPPSNTPMCRREEEEAGGVKDAELLDVDSLLLDGCRGDGDRQGAVVVKEEMHAGGLRPGVQ